MSDAVDAAMVGVISDVDDAIESADAAAARADAAADRFDEGVIVLTNEQIDAMF